MLIAVLFEVPASIRSYYDTRITTYSSLLYILQSFMNKKTCCMISVNSCNVIVFHIITKTAAISLVTNIGLGRGGCGGCYLCRHNTEKDAVLLVDLAKIKSLLINFINKRPKRVYVSKYFLIYELDFERDLITIKYLNLQTIFLSTLYYSQMKGNANPIPNTFRGCDLFRSYVIRHLSLQSILTLIM